MRRAWIGALAVVLLAGFGAVAWFLVPRPVEPKKTKEQGLAEIDSSLHTLASKGFSGSVLLSQDGEVWLAKGYGLADRAARRAVTPDMGFDIGSLVKPFTAAAVLKLKSQGKLRLLDPIGAFLPNVPPDKARITVQELLSHSSGLPDIVDGSSDPMRYTPSSTIDLFPATRSSAAPCAPGFSSSPERSLATPISDTACSG